MADSVYLETSIIGYLASRPSGDLITAANQKLTLDWWDKHRAAYNLYVSLAVVAECAAGDPTAAAERAAYLSGIAIVDANAAAESLARRLLRGTPLPAKARIDASHIALATVHGIDYLLTWNCKHIANAALQIQIAALCRAEGFEAPRICTPQQLMGM